MQKKLLRGALVGAALVFICSLVPATVSAHEGQEDEEETTAQSTTGQKEDRSELRKEHAEKRLTNAKLRVCEARKKNINTIMTRGVVRAEKQLKLFTAITDRVKSFYVKKGNTLANYSELVAAVDTAKAKTETDLATLRSLGGQFKCNSDDPKGDAAAYKSASKAVSEDLKAYRTAVKNLIVGVKSVQQDRSAAGAQQ